MEIGRRIRDRRKELHMTQRQLAERVFVTTQAVSQWENGRTVPDPFNLGAIAGALRMGKAELNPALIPVKSLVSVHQRLYMGSVLLIYPGGEVALCLIDLSRP